MRTQWATGIRTVKDSSSNNHPLTTKFDFMSVLSHQRRALNLDYVTVAVAMWISQEVSAIYITFEARMKPD